MNNYEHVFVPNIQKPHSEHDSSEQSEASASNLNSQCSDEDDWVQSEIEEELSAEEEASVEAVSEHVSENESAKEQSEGPDYGIPPTVKWLLYPDDDEDDDEASSKSIHFNFNFS